jgi:hypothetical protein
MRVVISWSTVPELRGLSKERRIEVLRIARGYPQVNKRVLWTAILVQWSPGLIVGFIWGFLSHPPKGALPPTWLLPFFVIGMCIAAIMAMVVHPSLEYHLLRPYLATAITEKEARA